MLAGSGTGTTFDGTGEALLAGGITPGGTMGCPCPIGTSGTSLATGPPNGGMNPLTNGPGP